MFRVTSGQTKFEQQSIKSERDGFDDTLSRFYETFSCCFSRLLKNTRGAIFVLF